MPDMMHLFVVYIWQNVDLILDPSPLRLRLPVFDVGQYELDGFC